MNNPSEFELDLDLQMLPAWARQPATSNRYANFEGGGEGPRERRRDDRPFRRDRPREEQRRSPGGGGFGGRREGRPGDRPGFNREREPRHQPPREPEAPLPEVVVQLVPERKGIESLARQIKLTGRAYPLFQVAALILKRPERFEVHFATKKGPDGKILQPLFVCSLDETLWLSEDEVAQHVLRHHFDAFYQTEKVATEAPKGTYTLVAQCGMSGVILGPPNYHDYQVKLHKLHSERFSNLPFEAYKARVKIVRDEAVVKQWLEEQSWKCEYIGLNLPEPVRFTTREDAEKHFRETHLPNLIKSVDSFVLLGLENQRFMSRGLRAALRETLEEQRRFPLKVATVLSQQLAGQGLQFFKVNKTVTHVCVARPHHLDIVHSSISDGVRRIVEFIDAHTGCSRRDLLDALAPIPPAPATPAPAAPEAAAATDGTSEKPAAATGPAPTPAQTAVITDLHWLIHQGHVIEFTDGRMETAKAPKPMPPPKAPRPAPSKPQEGKPTNEPVAATAEPTAGAPAVVAPEAAPTEVAPVVETSPPTEVAPPVTTPEAQTEPKAETPLTTELAPAPAVPPAPAAGESAPASEPKPEA